MLLLCGDTQKKRGKRKPHKLRLLSSTKGEESRMKLYTGLNQKLWILKLRKLRNACNKLMPYPCSQFCADIKFVSDSITDLISNLVIASMLIIP